MAETIDARSAVRGIPLDLRLSSGRLRAERFGPERAPLVLCIPGLSANLRSFDFLAERLAAPNRQIVAVDLRGRGLSDTTPPGTYGWENHARDVIEIADAFGADEFAILGQSMGGFVAMEVARQAPSRIGRLVLLDVCGVPDQAAVTLIMAGLQRLGAVYPSTEAYLGFVRAAGIVRPWSGYWERYFRYELAPVDGDAETNAGTSREANGGTDSDTSAESALAAVRARSNPAAVLEDAAYGERHAASELWSWLTMPVLLLRASAPLAPVGGFVMPEDQRDAFVARVPTARVVEVDANHYGINTHEESARAIDAFLREGEG